MKEYIVFDIETTGLNPYFGNRVTCICGKNSRGRRLETTNQEEKIILESFHDWLAPHNIKDFVMITKNGEGFDIPFILARAAILGYYYSNTIHERLMRVFAKYQHFDLQKVTPKRVSLENMAKILGCKMKSGDGLNAIKLWHEGRFEELTKYCTYDVDVTEEVALKYLKLNGLELVGNSYMDKIICQ